MNVYLDEYEAIRRFSAGQTRGLFMDMCTASASQLEVLQSVIRTPYRQTTEL